jgi:hypothetical membrane protein|tara:strand:- start:687 stop:1367 length:681 start_codon:yes stop_codon:yes gene_type:complete
LFYFWTVKVIRFVPIFFVLASIIAAYFYAGGNIHNPSQVGYSVTHNFLSDLGGFKSHSGKVNILSALLFNISMIMFILVGVSFLFVPRLFKENKTNYFLSILGSIFFFLGTVFFAGVGFTPYDLYLDMHVFFAINAFRFLIPASVLYFTVLLRSSISNKYALAIIVLFLFTFFYVVYQIVSASPLESLEKMVEQATLQKIIALINVVSIFILSFAFEEQIRKLKLD